jgi:rod shape-determining protein MreC
MDDRKSRKSACVFLTLSCALLLVNIFAPVQVKHAKHIVSDKAVIVSEKLAGPRESIQTAYSRVQGLWSVQAHNEMLAAENQRLLEWFQTANRLDAENKALRDLLNMKDNDALALRSAKILNDNETPFSRTILVQMGQTDGLEKGQGVLSHEGLLGRVVETGQKTARVLLMKDANSRIPVTVEGSRDRAILAGVNDGDPVLDHLPDQHAIEAGQTVVTSGHGGVFPYGVPVGVTYLNENGQLAVKPFANANRASHVQIVDYGIPAGSATRSTASASGVLR